jgi:hypothetical protein
MHLIGNLLTFFLQVKEASLIDDESVLGSAQNGLQELIEDNPIFNDYKVRCLAQFKGSENDRNTSHLSFWHSHGQLETAYDRFAYVFSHYMQKSIRPICLQRNVCKSIGRC